MESNSEQLNRIEGLVETLAISTAKGFDRVEERFEQIDARFEKLDSKVDGLQRAVDAGFERTGLLEARVSKVEEVLHP
jgi:hypothetical protein